MERGYHGGVTGTVSENKKGVENPGQDGRATEESDFKEPGQDVRATEESDFKEPGQDVRATEGGD